MCGNWIIGDLRAGDANERVGANCDVGVHMGERTHGDLDVLFSYMMDRCDWGRRLGSIAMRLDG